jgi:hypothetical protein
MTRRYSFCLLGLGLLACGGDPPCALDADISGGCGVMMGEEPLRLGDEIEAMIGVHGEPSWVELGSAGRWFDYTEQGVSGASADGVSVDSLLLAAPFSSTTADGLGIGSDELAVPQTLGAGQGSPWMSLNWQLEHGLGFESQDGAVSRIHLIPAQEPW